LPAHKTKIVCTIGPASRSEAVLEQLISRGMNVARLNFAHGTLPGHRLDLNGCFCTQKRNWGQFA
jgi:pyruvate kinase